MTDAHVLEAARLVVQEILATPVPHLEPVEHPGSIVRYTLDDRYVIPAWLHDLALIDVNPLARSLAERMVPVHAADLEAALTADR